MQIRKSKPLLNFFVIVNKKNSLPHFFRNQQLDGGEDDPAHDAWGVVSDEELHPNWHAVQHHSNDEQMECHLDVGWAGILAVALQHYAASLRRVIRHHDDAEKDPEEGLLHLLHFDFVPVQVTQAQVDEDGSILALALLERKALDAVEVQASDDVEVVLNGEMRVLLEKICEGDDAFGGALHSTRPSDDELVKEPTENVRAPDEPDDGLNCMIGQKRSLGLMLFVLFTFAVGSKEGEEGRIFLG